ncbi:MAG: hypothetical protein AAFQ95_14830 [Cyanobacteria bacterium J06621_3]
MMHFSNFDPARWDHWLLIAVFCAITTWGLMLSGQWQRERQEKQAKAKLARRLMSELHNLPGADHTQEIKQSRR